MKSSSHGPLARNTSTAAHANTAAASTSTVRVRGAAWVSWVFASGMVAASGARSAAHVEVERPARRAGHGHESALIVVAPRDARVVLRELREIRVPGLIEDH